MIEREPKQNKSLEATSVNDAKGSEHIARITPKNPSTAGRAAQLREIAKLLD
jgi:hypothetical protein